jgi:predicted ester cyclase
MINRSRLVTVFFMALIAAVVPLRGQIVQAQADQTETNKVTAARIFDAFSDSARLTEIEPLIAADFTASYPTGDMGWDSIKASLEAVNNAMPDLTMTPLIMVAEGNYVAMRYRFTGTFTNALLNYDGSEIPPTGQPITLESNAILTFNDEGQSLNFTEVFDNLTFMTQLGVIPADPAMRMTHEPVDPAVWAIADTTEDFTAALRERVLEINTAAYGSNDTDALDMLYAPDYVVYPTMTDLAGVKSEIAMLHQAFSDLQIELVTLVAEGNWVAYHWRASGTFTGEATFGGMTIASTNQPVSYDGVVFGYANDDGLIVAEWNEVDNLALAMQLGMFAQ